MLEITQEILEKIDPLLDAGDTDSAGKLLMPLDRTSLSALLIRVIQDRGTAVADKVGVAFLRATANDTQRLRAT